MGRNCSHRQNNHNTASPLNKKKIGLVLSTGRKEMNYIRPSVMCGSLLESDRFVSGSVDVHLSVDMYILVRCLEERDWPVSEIVRLLKATK
jgi:hypothetical protein